MKTTIEIQKIPFEVEFNYTPEEKEVLYYKDGTGYPGCDSKVELIEVMHKGTDFLDFLSIEQIKDFEAKIEEYISGLEY